MTVFKGREGSYLRQTALVTVERASKTRARFTVAVLYKHAGNAWQFAEIAPGTVEEVAGAGCPAAPSNEKAVKFFSDAWKKMRPDFEVQSLEVLGQPKFNQSGGRYCLNYNLATAVTGTKKGFKERFGKKFKCTSRDFSSVLKWDPQAKSWAADESAIQNINESADCQPAE